MSIKTSLLGLTSAAALAAIPSAAHADGGLSFIINGDTFSAPFSISNTSTAGELVTGFGITLRSPYGFDTVQNGFGINDATAFQPVGGTAAITGYTGPSSFAEASSSIDFTFTDFQVGETFSWIIDVDSPSVGQVFGSDLIGSTGYADFSNGLRGTGTFQAFGTLGSQFVINSFTPTPPPAGAVPEPGTWALLILGFGAVGGAMRRRSGSFARTRTRYAFAHD